MGEEKGDDDDEEEEEEEGKMERRFVCTVTELFRETEFKDPVQAGERDPQDGEAVGCFRRQTPGKR